MNNHTLFQSSFSLLQKIVPEEVINQIRGGAQRRRITKWEAADQAELVYSLSVAAYGQELTYFDSCDFVAALTDYEYSASTVKSYALTARQFPIEEREKYLWREIPFDHYRLCARAKQEKKADALEVLAASVAYYQEEGRSLSTKKLKKLVATSRNWKDWKAEVAADEDKAKPRKTDDTVPAPVSIPSFYESDESDDGGEEVSIDVPTALTDIASRLTSILPVVSQSSSAKGRLLAWIVNALRALSKDEEIPSLPPV